MYIFKRTLAYLLDCVVAFTIAMLIIQWLILVPIRSQFGIDDAFFQIGWKMELYVFLSISLPIWLYFSIMESSRRRGAFGKTAIGLKVEDEKGEKLSFKTALYRTILKLLPWEIAHFGIAFPEPLYYMDEPELRILSIVGLALFFVYFISIVLSKNSQSLYDSILKVRVVEKPRK